MKLLLERSDIDVNAADYFNLSSIPIAALKSNRAAAELLLTRLGIDINSKDRDGYTSVQSAMIREIMALEELLSGNFGGAVAHYCNDELFSLGLYSQFLDDEGMLALGKRMQLQKYIIKKSLESQTKEQTKEILEKQQKTMVGLWADEEKRWVT